MSFKTQVGSTIRQLVLTTTVHGFTALHLSTGNNGIIPSAPDAMEERPVLEDASVLALTLSNLLKDVSKAAGKLPLVEGIAGVVSQLLSIRQELQTQSKRCNELLEKVLRRGKVVFEQWAKFKAHKDGERFQDLMKQLEEYHSLLAQVYHVLKRMTKRSFFRRLFDRGLEDLNELDRRIDSFGVDIILRGVTQTLSEANANGTATESNGFPMESPATLLPPEPLCMLERHSQRDDMVSSLLSSCNARIVVLGMGGIGKTALACSVMRDSRVAEAHPRRLFVSFEGLTTSELAYNALANIFMIPVEERKSETQILMQILYRLGETQTLICIDNFETFWESTENRHHADDFLGQLASLPTLALIVTMRGNQTPSGIRWSRIGPLEPLTMSASHKLVWNITQGELGEGDKDSLDQLLDAVAGIPLAISLVGNLLRDGTETAQSLWHRWEQENAYAIGTEVVDRQHRLDVSLKVSIFSSRMSEEARSILAALAVLPIGLSSEDSWLDEFQALLPSTIHLRDCIRAIRNTALCSLDTHTVPPRYQLLSPIRLFCSSNLTLDSEVIHKLIDIYTSRLSKYPNYNSSSEYTWFTNELTNITSLFNLAFSLPYVTEDLAYASATYTEWMDYLATLSTDILEKAIDSQPDSSKAKARCLQSLVDVLRRQYRYAETVDLLKQALVIHEYVGDLREAAWDLMMIGESYRMLERFDEAEGAVEDAIKVYQGQSHVRGEGNCQWTLSKLYTDMGDYQRAETSALRSLELHRSAKSQLGEANALSALGLAYSKAEKFELAIETLTTAKHVSEEVKYTYCQALVMLYLGQIHEILNHLDLAASEFQESITLYEKCSTVVDTRLAKDSLSRVLSKLDLQPHADDLQSNWLDDVVTALGNT